MSKNLRILITEAHQEQMFSTPSPELTDFLHSSLGEEIDSLIDKRIKMTYVTKKVNEFNKLKKSKNPESKTDKGPSPAKSYRSAIQERVVEIMNMTPTQEFNEYLQAELDEEIDALVQKRLTRAFILQKVSELTEAQANSPKQKPAAAKPSEEPSKPAKKGESKTEPATDAEQTELPAAS